MVTKQGMACYPCIHVIPMTQSTDLKVSNPSSPTTLFSRHVNFDRISCLQHPQSFQHLLSLAPNLQHVPTRFPAYSTPRFSLADFARHRRPSSPRPLFTTPSLPLSQHHFQPLYLPFFPLFESDAQIPNMNASCQCGAIAFKTPLPKPLAVYICHCDECRRQSSSAFGCSAIFPSFPLPASVKGALSCYSYVSPFPPSHSRCFSHLLFPFSVLAGFAFWSRSFSDDLFISSSIFGIKILSLFSVRGISTTANRQEGDRQHQATP